MTWGRDTDEIDAAEQLRDFVDAGGNLVDTAASYGGGQSESMIGSLLAGKVDRRDVLLCTKAGIRTTADGNTVDASRGRCSTRSTPPSNGWAPTTSTSSWCTPGPAHPFDETLSALRLAVTTGRARYVGLSNHPGGPPRGRRVARRARRRRARCRRAGVLAAAAGIEREVVPAAIELGFGVLAWSPLGRGVLTGKYRSSLPADSRVRPRTSPGSCSRTSTGVLTHRRGRRDRRERPGACTLDVALAWLLERPAVSSAIVGARTPAQLRASLAACDLELPDAVHYALDDVSALSLGYPERW
ncbi:aldo/keto reductase [Oerskovia sp. M15]